ncbi:MAG: hypothetical protein ABSG80_14820 [Verrucomicrobiota bacterium]|jgi:hypothetical protein
MRAILDFVNGRLQQMPRGLSVLTNAFLLFAVLFPVVTLLLLVAHGHDSYFVINGTQVTYDEFWRRGGFWTFLLVGIYCAVLVYGFLHASRWSRPLFLLPCVVGPILAVIYHHTTLTLYNYLSGLFGTALLVWYLYFRQTVRDYYAKTHKPVASYEGS